MVHYGLAEGPCDGQTCGVTVARPQSGKRCGDLAVCERCELSIFDFGSLQVNLLADDQESMEHGRCLRAEALSYSGSREVGADDAP